MPWSSYVTVKNKTKPERQLRRRLEVQAHMCQDTGAIMARGALWRSGAQTHHTSSYPWVGAGSKDDRMGKDAFWNEKGRKAT